MDQLELLKEQHEINNGRPANKYEVAIYESLVSLKWIEEKDETVRQLLAAMK